MVDPPNQCLKRKHRGSKVEEAFLEDSTWKKYRSDFKSGAVASLRKFRVTIASPSLRANKYSIFLHR
jgi:hypothetical protein